MTISEIIALHYLKNYILNDVFKPKHLKFQTTFEIHASHKENNY